MMIDHDLHIHTSLSLCAKQDATLEMYLTKAKERGMRLLGLSNHLWDSAVPGPSDFYKPQDFAHISLLKKEIEALPEDPARPRILFGAEGEFAMEHKLAITEECVKQLDYYIVPHSHTHMLDFVMPASYARDTKRHADYLVETFEALVQHPLHRYITAIAHPFVPVGRAFEQDEIVGHIKDSTFEKLFRQAAENGIALEVNTSTFTYHTGLKEVARSEYTRMFRIAVACGCRFMVGSDAHTSADYVYFDRYADFLTDLYGITEDRLIDLVQK